MQCHIFLPSKHQKIECTQCKKDISKHNMSAHLKKCLKQPKHVCQYKSCPYTSAKGDLLKRHMKTHARRWRKNEENNCLKQEAAKASTSKRKFETLTTDFIKEANLRQKLAKENDRLKQEAAEASTLMD